MIQNKVHQQVDMQIMQIGNHAFAGCTQLSSLTVPETVSWIGSSAFSGCPLLTVIVIRGSYADEYCKGAGCTYKYTDSDDWLKD